MPARRTREENEEGRERAVATRMHDQARQSVAHVLAAVLVRPDTASNGFLVGVHSGQRVHLGSIEKVAD